MHFIIDVTEKNIDEVLQKSQISPVVFSFYSQSNPSSGAFLATLENLIKKHNLSLVLAKVNADIEHNITAQFRIRTTPTTYLFKEGKAYDAFLGELAEEELLAKLQDLAPNETQSDLIAAYDAYELGEFTTAVDFFEKFYKSVAVNDVEGKPKAQDLLENASDHKKVFASALFETNSYKKAQQILDSIPTQDRDAFYQEIMAKIDLLDKANNDELDNIKALYEQEKSVEKAMVYAKALYNSNHFEQSLDLLFSYLNQDLNIGAGEVKAQYLEIITALGKDPLARKYRSKLYAKIY